MIKTNYEAWAKNALAFIAERSLRDEFKDWCGGWPTPFEPERLATVQELVQTLREAIALLDDCEIAHPLRWENAIAKATTPSPCPASSPHVGQGDTCE